MKSWIQERSLEPCPCKVPIPQTQDTPGVIWTHDDEQIIRSTIQDVIKRAREELLISTFSLCKMTEHPKFLIDPLRKAIEQHNLRVRFLMRSRNHFETQRRDAQTLAEIGVEIFADSLNHAKGIIADESAAALFSANFDARHGLDCGVETGVRLDGLPALKSAKRYFEYAMRNSNIDFMVNPRQKDANRRLVAGWCEKCPFDHGITVECFEKHWQEFKGASASGPVLFTSDNRDSARLYAGRTAWDLLVPVNGRKSELSPAGWLENAKSTDDLLKGWLRNVQRDKSVGVKKGFCPAVFNRSSL
jgi:PIN domain nuclease of toxin-antitoxin system